MRNRGITKKILSEEGRSLGNFIASAMKVSLPQIKIVLTPLAKSVLILLRLAPATSPTDGTIQKKIHGLRKSKLII